MIMKKINLNGVEAYTPISKAEARQCFLNHEEIIFTDEDEEEEFYEEQEEMEQENEEYAIDRTKDNSKASKLFRILPFMDQEDIHEITEAILNQDDDLLKDIPIITIFPYLSSEDCDAVFMKALEKGNYNFKPSAIAPFVSNECLSKVVDLYLEGNFSDVDIDSIYPYLSSKDIKRVFQYILSKK